MLQENPRGRDSPAAARAVSVDACSEAKGPATLQLTPVFLGNLPAQWIASNGSGMLTADQQGHLVLADSQYDA